MKHRLAEFIPAWMDVLLPVLQVLLIVVCAWLINRLLRRAIDRLVGLRKLPLELAVGGRRAGGFLILVTASLLILERFGVSSMLFWSAITGFVTVAAVAFFAAWSVLTNIFCSLLIYLTRPFRLHDHVEVLENGDKPGLGGEVLDIRLFYTTLRETAADGRVNLLRMPNSLFFQRITRVQLRAGVEADDPPATDSKLDDRPETTG